MSTNAAGSSMPTLEALCRQFGELLEYATKINRRSTDLDRYLENGNVPRGESKDEAGLTTVPPLLQIQELGQFIQAQLTTIEGNVERVASILGVGDPNQPQTGIWDHPSCLVEDKQRSGDNG